MIGPPGSRGLSRTLLWGGCVAAVGALGLWLYLRYVWYAGPTLTWQRHGIDYELLAPRMLGIVMRYRSRPTTRVMVLSTSSKSWSPPSSGSRRRGA